MIWVVEKFLEIFGSYKCPLWMAIANFLMLVGVLSFMLVFGGARCLQDTALVSSCVKGLYPESPCALPPTQIQKAIDSSITKVGVDCFTRAIQTCQGKGLGNSVVGFNVSLWTTTTTTLNSDSNLGGS